ncbi:glycosyltransferase family 2 protein [Roseovarius sp. SCSIO 43702]|uniref:glycosyltransferase family 2 protein n=1 Tax=Roseovarius sp. SCSIO 43702 TaxID=2823043 RepID=UPI001C735242|nr:glycosyltransferase family 2 protein [Roseovarius sp. SCSIO 43702]QYX55605.1 glycosyltransferase family 2 protein [Roseovarius sp. SCSIO 43702]
MRPAKWGIVSTVRAETRPILDFVAHHLSIGAHRIHIYLDEDNPEARAALATQPRVMVIVCDDDYWENRGGRPDKHQARQTRNATKRYRRRPGVEWLAHIDVDEFLWPETPIGEQLNSLKPDAEVARVWPIEALANPGPDPEPGTWFKSYSRQQRVRREQTAAIYPEFGIHLNGGFLSHVAGKVFVRTGIPKVNFRIHNAFIHGVQMDREDVLKGVKLCHLHAPDFEHWQRAYRYRLEKGSYRADLKPAPSPDGAGLNMNALFSMLEADGGEEALRRFYDEVCTATPGLRTRLAEFGLLQRVDLDLDRKRAEVFPDHA